MHDSLPQAAVRGYVTRRITAIAAPIVDRSAASALRTPRIAGASGTAGLSGARGGL
ncbi:MAG: hypothetical protein HYR85_07940 [Planctomycetes bacterium]|nr:hypothetical protein [Planctomycetota bacterium]